MVLPCKTASLNRVTPPVVAIPLTNFSTSKLPPSPLQRGKSYTPQIVNINGGFAPAKTERRKKSKALTTFNSEVFSMWYLPYNKNLKEFSRQLRNHSTIGEILLWKKLRAGTMMTCSFNRQKPLNKYIVDFYCKPLNLVIEVDGEYHNEPVQRVKDKERQQILESMKLNFLRFSEQQVRKDMEMVLKSIENYIVSLKKSTRN